jgi:excisionase family DNA binding protein
MMPRHVRGFFLPTERSLLLIRLSVNRKSRKVYVVSEDDQKIAVTPAWLNYKQAEAYANLSRTTLWQLINARRVRAARIGRAVRIERDSLQAFMEQSSDESGGWCGDC